MLGLQRANIPG